MTAAASLVVVCLNADAPASSVSRVLDQLGVGANDPRWRRHGDKLLSVRAIDMSDGRVERVRELPCVRQVVPLPKAESIFECWSDELKKVELSSGAVFGGSAPTVIAGPCSVESEAQLLETAHRVAAAGAQVLRGSVFKPRSSPFDFGGLGAEGLEHLALARDKTGLPVVTEVLDSSHLDLVSRHVDMFQIGSRNMQNSSLLFEIAAHESGLPILLKRGLAATLDEVVQAVAYVLLGRLSAGHDRPGVVLCERGIRTFERSTRFTLDVGAIPILQKRSGLPVIADPSHAAGTDDLVAPLARAALAAGADGLIVEVHPDTEHAWCDGAQSLTFDAFEALMAAPLRTA